MNEISDQELLRDYAERQSEPAFAELLRRHIDFVYSAALRMVSDPHTAEDVTQNTFIALSKNALLVRNRSVLSSWLHSTARNLAANAVRTEVRRREREKEAAVMNELLAHEPEAVWKNIAPHLDDAIAELGEADRDALLLRFFERKSAREMGQIFGTSEEAAQKRVTRAVDRLRGFFSKRGLTIGAGGLVVLISANAVHAAPAALAGTISTAIILTTTAHTSTAMTATKVIAMTTAQKILIAATVAILAGAGIYEARQAMQLRAQIHTLQQQQTPFAAQIQKLQQERDDAANKLAAFQEGKQLSERDNAELLKLRSQVTQLQRELASRTNSNTVPSSPQTAPTYDHYYVYDGPFKAAMRTKLAAMSDRLRLSVEQKQAAEGILTNMYNKDPEGQIKALLSPEQQAAYHQFKQEEATANVQNKLKAEAAELQYGLGLTYEQRNQVSAALYDVELNDALAKLEAVPPGDPLTSWAQEAAREEKLAENKYHALTNILTPSQLENFRALQADDLQRMRDTIEQGKKSYYQSIGQTSH